MSEEKKAQSDRKGAGYRWCHCCGREFWSDYPFERYCSPECRAEISRKQKRNARAAKRKARQEQEQKKKNPDSISWDEIRAVLGELGIASYQKAIEVIEQRRKEAKEKELAEAFEKEKKDD